VSECLSGLLLGSVFEWIPRPWWAQRKAGRPAALVRLPRTPRSTTWAVLGLPEAPQSQAMPWHATDLQHKIVCAVTECWVALAWLGEMILTARNVAGPNTRSSQGSQDGLTGSKAYTVDSWKVSGQGLEWICQEDRRLVTDRILGLG
jgi:hypothetical protein